MAVLNSLRNAIQSRSPSVGIALFVAILCVCLVIVWQMGWVHSKPHAPTNCYYLDEEAFDPQHPKELSVNLVPPVAGASGNLTLVRAVYITAGTDAERQLAYLEKYTDEAKAVLEKSASSEEHLSPQELMTIRDGLRVRAPELGSPWVTSNSPEGRALLGRTNDDAATVRRVLPSE